MRVVGLDERIASVSDGTTLLVVAAVAVALGLRHAADPDHLAAVATLVASGRERSGRLAARLGFAWGLGHASALFVLGVPIVLYRTYLPAAVQSGAETGVGFVIVLLAAWLLLRWRRGAFAGGRHRHEDGEHAHVHPRTRAHAHTRTRTPLQAYAVGLVHGTGGSAGVGVLLLSGIRDHTVAVVALALFACFTAVSMTLLSAGLGLTLGTARARRSLHLLAPVLAGVSLAFGIWYALGAQGVVSVTL